VVVDVGRMTGRGWGVVEANPAWASGLCGCDPAGVLPVLRRATVPRHAVPEAEGALGTARPLNPGRALAGALAIAAPTA
jgi:hypothetical protein